MPSFSQAVGEERGQNAKSNHIKGSGMWKGGGKPSYSAMTISSQHCVMYCDCNIHVQVFICAYTCVYIHVIHCTCTMKVYIARIQNSQDT